MSRARWLAVVALIVLALFAWKGGTYSVHDYRALKADADSAQQREHELAHEVDSLQHFRDSLKHDPAVQERVARESFGMVRPGEISFTVIPDTVKH